MQFSFAFKSCIALSLFFTVLLTNLYGQISGLITAPNGKPLEGAEIFINRTTILSTTDEFGQFTLIEIPPGFHEIVVYKKGYALYRAPMRVQEGRSYNLNLQLQGLEKKSKEKSSREEIVTFNRALLGDDGLIAFNEEKKIQVEASSGKYRIPSGPVVIEYPNAGYRITCFFSTTTYQEVGDVPYHFQEYHGSDVNQNIAFEKTRMALFRGSTRHWLMALVAGRLSEEGFTIHDPHGAEIDGKTLASPSATVGYDRIRITQPLTVRYQNQESTVQVTDPIDVNRLGVMINPKLLLVTGDMNQPGLAHQLPLDYKPIANVESTFAEALKFFYEKIYIHTDKPYYYPGEPLWFKAYVNYYHRDWQDSLSDLMYVELIGPDRKVLIERMFRIEKGVSYGDFVFPDTLKEGTYYLRGYTSLRRNFGDDGLFTKPLRVLNIMDKMDPAQRQPAASPRGVAISSDQPAYHVRDKITLDIMTKDSLGNPLAANLSVSVTDAAQAIAIPEVNSILGDFPIRQGEISKIDELKFRIERGVSFYGQFLNNKGIGEKTQLSFIQWRTGDMLSAETDDNGMFWQTGLQFTDSAKFSYKSDKAKGRPYGSVVILEHDVPKLQAPQEPDLKILKAGTVQRIISEYEVPKDNKLLEEVEVKGSRINNEELERIKRRPYGMADHTVSANSLNLGTGNLLYALAGKVPGLVVNPSQGVVYFSRAMGTSITNPIGPMVTVNDIPMSGEAGNVLQTIDINSIESIEFTARLNVMYGTQGAYGVISVYTKTGMSIDNTDPNFQTLKLPGFSKSRTFSAPDYSNPKTDATQTDFRATLYWNPDLRTDSSTGSTAVSFFASDLPGLYRVVVEGVTAYGTPVRIETYLTIEEKR